MLIEILKYFILYIYIWNYIYIYIYTNMLSRVWLFCDPMDCCLPGSSVHGIFQARILKWFAISYSRGSSWPRNWNHVSCVSCIGRQILYHCVTWEVHMYVCVCVYIYRNIMSPCLYHTTSVNSSWSSTSCYLYPFSLHQPHGLFWSQVQISQHFIWK